MQTLRDDACRLWDAPRRLWADVDGGWLVRRANRLTAAKQNSTTGYPDFASAWANRVTLDYS